MLSSNLHANMQQQVFLIAALTPTSCIYVTVLRNGSPKKLIGSDHIFLRGIVAQSFNNPALANCTSASAAIKGAQPLNIKLLILQSFFKLNSDQWKNCVVLAPVSL